MAESNEVTEPGWHAVGNEEGMIAYLCHRELSMVKAKFQVAKPPEAV